MAASVHPSASHHPSNPGVHEDLLVEILKRLPLKALYRFRCVCRSWNSLLSSPFFISHRLRFAATETTFFRVTYADNRNDPPSYTLHDHQDSLITSLDSPLQFHIAWAFIGVVHGVVCLVYRTEPISMRRDSFHIAFWNPTIRKYIDIPWPDRVFGRFSELKGFGFDASNNDFKLLILNPHVFVVPGFYDVISVREGVWRRKPLPHHLGFLHFLEIPGYTYTCSSGCFINGNIHWVIPSPRTFHGSKSYRLLLFDCEREEFTTMNLPEEVRGLGGPWPQLLAYDGSLQLLIFNGGRDSGYFEAWRMDEYGVATSWSKQHNVLPNDQLRPSIRRH